MKYKFSLVTTFVVSRRMFEARIVVPSTGSGVYILAFSLIPVLASIVGTAYY